MTFRLPATWRLLRYCRIVAYGESAALQRAVWPPRAHAPTTWSITGVRDSMNGTSGSVLHVVQSGVKRTSALSYRLTRSLRVGLLRVCYLFVNIFSATYIGSPCTWIILICDLHDTKDRSTVVAEYECTWKAKYMRQLRTGYPRFDSRWGQEFSPHPHVLID